MRVLRQTRRAEVLPTFLPLPFPRGEGCWCHHPERMKSLIPGLRGPSYPGCAMVWDVNPERGAASFRRSVVNPTAWRREWIGRGGDATLTGLGVLSMVEPRVARGSQPWAEGFNPFGIGLEFGHSGLVNPKGCQRVAGGRRSPTPRRPPGNGAGDVLHPGRGAGPAAEPSRSEQAPLAPRRGARSRTQLSGGRSPLALNDHRPPSGNPPGWPRPVSSAGDVQTPVQSLRDCLRT